jgi:hypothetical protein
MQTARAPGPATDQTENRFGQQVEFPVCRKRRQEELSLLCGVESLGFRNFLLESTPKNSGSAPLLHIASLPRLDWTPTVAVPARNEAQRLPSLFRSLSEQSWLRANGKRLNVTIALNNCGDDSVAVAGVQASLHPRLVVHLIEVNFPEHLAHVGSARRLAAETALWEGPDTRTVLMTTDADAAPASSWVENNLRAIEEGADAVGGLILGDEAEVALLDSGVRRRR